MKRLELPDSSIVVKKVIKYDDTDRPSATSVDMYLGKGVDIGGGGTSDFNNLDNLPKYNNIKMSGDTNIPEVKVYTAGDGISISNDNVISVSSGSDDIVYAEIDYYPFTEGYSADYLYNATLNNIDADKYSAWLDTHPVMSEWGTPQWQYSPTSNLWGIQKDWGEYYEYTEEEMYAETGLDLVVTDTTNYAYVIVSYGIDINTSAEPSTVEVIGKKQWDSLSFSEHNQHTEPLGENGVILVTDAIKNLYFDNTKVTYFPNNFCQYCLNLDIFSTLDKRDYPTTSTLQVIFGTVEEIGDRFLSHCINLYKSQMADIQFFGSKVIKIGSYFVSEMYYENPQDWTREDWARSYTFNFNFSALEEVGDYFFSNNSEFRPNLTMGCNMGKIGRYFLQSLHVPSIQIYCNKQLEIPSYFCSGNDSLTELYISPNTAITKIGDEFCSNCPLLQTIYIDYTQKLRLPNLEEVGNRFLFNCSSYNTVIELPKVTKIGDSFLSGASNFNQSISLPRVTTIGSEFMLSASSFNQDLTFPALLQLNISGFLGYANAFCSSVTFGNPGIIDISGDTTSSMFVTTDPTADIYVNGVTVLGSGRGLALYLPPPSSPYVQLYNNIKDGGGDMLSLSGSVAPTTSTRGLLGQLYVNLTNFDTYQCTAINKDTSVTPAVNVYTWTQRW